MANFALPPDYYHGWKKPLNWSYPAKHISIAFKGKNIHFGHRFVHGLIGTVEMIPLVPLFEKLVMRGKRNSNTTSSPPAQKPQTLKTRKWIRSTPKNNIPGPNLPTLPNTPIQQNSPPPAVINPIVQPKPEPDLPIEKSKNRVYCGEETDIKIIREAKENLAASFYSSEKRLKEGSPDHQNAIMNAKGYAAITEGLDIIGTEFNYRKIAGDGHCMFRAVGSGLLVHVNSHPEVADAILESIQKLSTSEHLLIDPPTADADPTQHQQTIVAAHKTLSEMFTLMKNDKAALDRLLNSEESSDHLVQALRSIAVGRERSLFKSDMIFARDLSSALLVKYAPLVESMASKLNYELEMLTDSLEIISHVTELHFNSIAAMKHPDGKGVELGAQDELKALENILGVNINLIDAMSSGNTGTIYQTPATERDVNLGQIHLLYCPSPDHTTGHYDLAVKKQP